MRTPSGRVEVEHGKRLAANRAHAAMRVGDLTPKRRLRMPVRIGLPTNRLRNGIASPWIVPLKRDPITRSSPGSSPRRTLSSLSGYVSSASPMTMNVALCGVEAREVRAAVPTTRFRDDDRACAVATSAERSVDPLSTTRPPPFARSDDPFERLVDHLADGVLLVQARDDHRYLWGCCQRGRS